MTRTLSLFLAFLLGAGCTPELTDPTNEGPPSLPPPPGPVRAAFLAEVDVRSGEVRVTAPQVSLTGLLLASDGPALSLVGGDVVTLLTSNFSASPAGAFQPGKIRVQFDLAVTNRLAQVSLDGPSTFPSPPSGTTGPLVFPFDIAVATTSGGTSGSGNDVIVVLPSRGLVAPSIDWNGAPFNFFNDADCAGEPASNDCYRWEEYPGPILTGASTSGQRVGFDIDPTVGQFTARILVAADIRDPSVPSPGAVQGQVVSASLGPLAGVTVVLTPPGQSTVTSGTGAFQFGNLPSGTSSLTLSGLPAACTEPAPTPILVPAGGVATLTIPVVCLEPPLVGSIQGTIVTTLNTPLAAISVQATPTGLGPAGTAVTDGAGQFVLSAIPVSDGSGLLGLSGLPSGCADPGPVPYSGLVTGTPLSLTVVVDCP